MSSEYGTFSSSTRGYGGGRARPDAGNRYYFRGGRGRGGGSPATSLSFPPEADIKKGLDTSKIIETIPAPPHPSALEDIPIENVQYVASYNWVDTEQPTLVVPGSPAVWTGREVPFSLQPDSGAHFVDQNGARMSEYPLLPLFAAADAIHDNKAPVDWPAVDVVTDRNGLRKLLRWLNPSEGREVRDFRIDVELVGAKTMVLNRWEGRTREPPIGKSYGFSFEAAIARAAPGCPSSGHHRTITYDMLDMKLMVRFEVDACLPTETGTATTTKTGTSDTKRSGRKSPELAIDELADALENLDLLTPSRAPTSPTISSSTSSSPTPSSPTPSSSSPSPALNIIRAGTQVPQESLLEVASRSIYYIDQLDWNELYPQLAISQTPGLRLGVHERGTFTEMREMQVDGDGSAGGPPVLEEQKRTTAAQFVRLARVLEDVQELAIARGPGPTGSFSLVCEGGQLRAYARKGVRRSCLPPDVRARFSRAGATAAGA
ncbi:hypothetical protein F5888DRAFT_1097862 [Russula emetica]|nr:hypothetical protein F5888DRAFT_1097862 [Russula emetica]